MDYLDVVSRTRPVSVMMILSIAGRLQLEFVHVLGDISGEGREEDHY